MNTTELLYSRYALAAALVLGLCLGGAAGWGLNIRPAAGLLLAALSGALLMAIVLILHMRRDARHLTQRFTDPGAATSAISLPWHLRELGEVVQNRLSVLDQQLAGISQDSERLRHVFNHSEDLIFVLDAEQRLIQDCNPRAAEALGLGSEALIGRPIDDFLQTASDVSEWHLSDGNNEYTRINRTGFIGSDGTVLSLDICLTQFAAEKRKLLLLMGRDTRERDEARSRIQHLAYHDNLTDLPNRTLLSDRVNRALKRTRRSRQIGALLFLDLDNFKRINDTLGHSIGDLLLRELASRLQRNLREEDTVSRLGGDEFVVLIETLGTDQDRAERQIREIAEKVREILAESYQLNEHELHVTGSIGFVTFPRDGETMETLLRHADLAMYHSKKAGRNTITRFENEMDETAAYRMRIESEVRAAMRDGDLHLYFQPIQRIRDGRMLGAEALLRWIHPRDGMIGPDTFLPQIEDSALMLRLSEWVMREAFTHLTRISEDRELYTPDYLAINISHQQFHQQDFVEQVKTIIDETGADPHRILFEITETVIMNNAQDARERMLRLKQMGFRFAIDDFGTGYSSLAYLKQLPADTLKIDKDFVRDVADDPDDAAIVKTILGIADHMGMCVIAEGVENYDQLSFLRRNNCTYYQGYLARPPLNLEEFHEELKHSQFLRVVQ